MDTRSKKYKAFKVWICFFLGLNILGFFIVMGLSVVGEFDLAMLGSDLKETQNFKHTLALIFDTLARYITDNLEIFDDIDESNQSEDLLRREAIIDLHLKSLEDEGENLIYYAKNPKTNRVFTNAQGDMGIESGDMISLPKGYNFYLYYDGERFLGEKDGKSIDIYHRGSGYKSTLLRSYLEQPDSYTESSGTGNRVLTNYREFYDIQGCQILLAVKEDIVENPYGYSSLYALQKGTIYFKWIIAGALLVFVLSIGFLMVSIIKRRYRREFEMVIGSMLGKIAIEIKIVAALIFILSLLNLFDRLYHVEFYHMGFITGLCFWWVYLVWIDLRINGTYVFSNNIINKLLQWYKAFERKRPFQKALLLRLYTLTGLEVLLIILTGIFILMTFASNNGIFFFIALALFLIGIYLYYRYVRRYNCTLEDIGRVIDHTEQIKQGDVSTKLQPSPNSDLYILGENLNAIQDGIAKAVDRSIKSERMKVELITNVSHDLKTPLTSIISYVDLLSKEENLPEHVKDYIKVLGQKSERLKLLIQDLFDLSKVVSGEIEVEMKTLDLAKLIEQTLADLKDKITESQLTFRVGLPESPVPITSDGNKLYRVFLNLLQNTLKYSLKGTRVYIDLISDDKKARVTIKNTANYEMNFSEEEIIERFVRGDRARSSEGSGLGLAIAQNFTHSCGGDFDIKVDGDLFKAILTFDIKPNDSIEYMDESEV